MKHAVTSTSLPSTPALAAPGLARARAVHGARVSAVGAALVFPLAAAGDTIQLFVGKLVALFSRRFQYLRGGHFPF